MSLGRKISFNFFRPCKTGKVIMAGVSNERVRHDRVTHHNVNKAECSVHIDSYLIFAAVDFRRTRNCSSHHFTRAIVHSVIKNVCSETGIHSLTSPFCASRQVEESPRDF